MKWTEALLLFIIGVLVYVLIFGDGCNSGSKNIISSDTTTVITYDTTWFDTTRFHSVSVPAPVTYYDTTYIKIVGEDTTVINASIYQDTVKNDSVSIFYKAEVFGTLNDLQLGYKLTYPTINRTETITIENTTQRPLRSFYLGVEADITHLNYFAAKATFNMDNGWSIEGGYDFKGKSIILGGKRRIF